MNLYLSQLKRTARGGGRALAFVIWICASATAQPFLRSALAQTSSGADPQAQTRLAWMREHQIGMWNVSPREGLYLYNLALKHHSKRALEIGTSNGYSGIWIASAMRATDGHLLTLEINKERAKLAEENFHAAGVEPFVTIKVTDALEEIAHLQGPYDFVFIDAWKADYVKYLDMVLPLVPPGGVIVAHNVVNLREELKDFIQRVKTSPQLRTTIEEPGPGGFSVSFKLPPK